MGLRVGSGAAFRFLFKEGNTGNRMQRDNVWEKKLSQEGAEEKEVHRIWGSRTSEHKTCHLLDWTIHPSSSLS